MEFSEAQSTDILRSWQRDESFLKEMQDSCHSLLKILGAKQYHNIRKIIPNVTNTWYYLMTSVSNIQTLGEEYTGILRVCNKQIPSKFVQILWLSLYLGGEALVERLSISLKNDVRTNNTLTEEAKGCFIRMLDFIMENKSNLKRIHHALFYIDGIYYHLSNRVTGIKYVLLRKWMEDKTFSQSFTILGYMTLFYILFNSIQQLWVTKSEMVYDSVPTNMKLSQKGCVLCAENRKNACATPCGHVFCWSCICDSLNYQQNCPICREVVNPSRVIFLQNYA